MLISYMHRITPGDGGMEKLVTGAVSGTGSVSRTHPYPLFSLASGRWFQADYPDS